MNIYEQSAQWGAVLEFWESIFDQGWAPNDIPIGSLRQTYPRVECMWGTLIMGGQLMIDYQPKTKALRIHPRGSTRYSQITWRATEEAFRRQRRIMGEHAGALIELAERLGVDCQEKAPEVEFEPKSVSSSRGEIERRAVVEAWLRGESAVRRGLRSRGGVLYSGISVIGTLDARGWPTTYQPDEGPIGAPAHIRCRDYVLTVAAPDQPPGWWTRRDGPDETAT